MEIDHFPISGDGVIVSHNKVIPLIKMEGIEDLKREINQRGGKKTMLYVEVYLKIRDQNNEIQGKIKRRR